MVYLRRDQKWPNGFNEWLSIMTRANHDCQFIITKAHVLVSIHYIIKYISKQEASLHSKLTLTAAVHKAMELSSNLNTDIGGKMVLKASNKIDSHREVGMPEAISHLMHLPDHFTGATTFYPHLLDTSGDNEDEASHVSQVDDMHVNDNEQENDANIMMGYHGFTLVPIFDDYVYRGEGLKDY